MSATMTKYVPMIRLNEMWLIGAAEAEVTQGGLYMEHVENVTITARPRNDWWRIEIKIDLHDKHEVFYTDVHDQTTIESLAFALYMETENMNRWINKNI